MAEDLDRLKTQAEEIYQKWDHALSTNDAAGLLALYKEDAVIESPLVPHLLKQEKGICQGHEEIKLLIEKVMERKPPLRKHYRKGFFTDGKTLMWEYPRLTPEGDQMDFVEVMELSDGLISHHRIYWGWLGFQVIKSDTYYRE